MEKVLSDMKMRTLHLVLQDLLQLTCCKLGDQSERNPRESLLQAAARIIKLGEVVSDVREQQDLIKRLRDARHDGVYVAVVQVKKDRNRASQSEHTRQH